MLKATAEPRAFLADRLPQGLQLLWASWHRLLQWFLVFGHGEVETVGDLVDQVAQPGLPLTFMLLNVICSVLVGLLHLDDFDLGVRWRDRPHQHLFLKRFYFLLRLAHLVRLQVVPKLSR